MCAVILKTYPSRQKIVDWLADEAVWCELLSVSNSLIIRENTGNYRDFSCSRRDLQKALVFSGVFARILYSTEQGILKREQRIILAEQGI